MDLDGMFKGNYMKADDVKQPILVTINNVTVETLEGNPKAVIHFAESEQGLVMNKTNYATVKNITGTSESAEWNGTKIVVYADHNIQFGNKTVSGLRIRAPKNVQPAEAEVELTPAAAQVETTIDDDIPF